MMRKLDHVTTAFGRHACPVVRLGFKPRRGRQPLLGRFDSCCLPPFHGLRPTSYGLRPTSHGLRPTSHGLRPTRTGFALRTPYMWGAYRA